MKMSRIALAMLVAAPFAAAQAGVTITPLVGYHWNTNGVDSAIANTGANNGPRVNDVKDAVSYGGAIGAELTPWLQAEVEYLQTKSKVEERATGEKYDDKLKQETVSLNFIGTANNEGKVRPYGLVGGGYSKYKAAGESLSKDTIGNVGAGVLVALNDVLSLRGEARGTYNFDREIWDAQALAGLQVVLGGHLRAAAPVVEAQPVEPVEAVVEAPRQEEQAIQAELRVFFDTNKSVIKQQYKPEIAKVADLLNQVPNATAKIDGHTDNTGPRKLNERLSLARANAVKSSLVNEFGIDANRLTTQGFAWDQPIADNSTREGRAMNRRVFATITGTQTVTVQPGQAQ